MTPQQKQIILIAWDHCDEEEKSTEYMLQYMSDMSGVSYGDVVYYIMSDQAQRDRDNYYENK